MRLGVRPRTAATMQNSVAPVLAVSLAALTSEGMSSHAARTGESNWPDCEQKWQSSGQPPVLSDTMPSTSTSGPHQRMRTSWASASSLGQPSSGSCRTSSTWASVRPTPRSRTCSRATARMSTCPHRWSWVAVLAVVTRRSSCVAGSNSAESASRSGHEGRGPLPAQDGMQATPGRVLQGGGVGVPETRRQHPEQGRAGDHRQVVEVGPLGQVGVLGIGPDDRPDEGGGPGGRVLRRSAPRC